MLARALDRSLRQGSAELISIVRITVTTSLFFGLFFVDANLIQGLPKELGRPNGLQKLLSNTELHNWLLINPNGVLLIKSAAIVYSQSLR